MPDIDIHKSTPAVIEWQSDDASHSLIEPDPKFGNITFTTSFDTACSFFELSVPIKIKHTRLKDDKDGDQSISALIIRINAAAVNTLSFASTTTAPDLIQKKLTSRASRLTRLDFRLGRNLDVLVPKNAEEPLVPARVHSGNVLDAIRQLSNSTSLSVYIQDAVLSVEELQTISSACSQGLVKAGGSDRHDLKSLYGGKGAKVVRLSAQTGQLPPPYNEITSPPPSAQSPPTYQRKRRRQDSEPEVGDATTKPSAVLGKEEGILLKIEDRLKRLEDENRRLREDTDERIKGLESENQRLRETIDKLLALVENRSDDIDHIGEQTSENAADLVTMDDELTHLRHDVDELKAKADSIDRGDLVETVKSDVLEYFRIRLWGND
ncbi:hypothetical protein F53441_6817 [Fusarium austroafricanum]|uniref:Uncharacterized protein n=1 Tax=Fusarium austroafricanum TaxID=2364996 RepID=A0A8H4NY97_9HYPO|nr:hypothetical protein F53441_6817 [Fusarium austroafricanum]